jgi:general L-amino acid transport system permease protein
MTMNVPPPQPHPPRSYPSGKHPDLPPPIATSGILGWLRQNLFSSLFTTSLTLIAVSLLYLFVSGAGGWMVFDSVVTADSRAACQAIDSGACWAVVTSRLDQFIYGFYPPGERWRPNLAFILLFVALTPILFSAVPLRRPLLWFAAAFPFIAGWLIYGGSVCRLSTPASMAVSC